MSVDPAHLDGLLSAAPNDPRIRYVSPLGQPRHLLHVRNDPLLQKINPDLKLPFEWQFAASRVDLAMNLTHGSSTILIGQVDTGVADIPDLKGKVDGRYYADGLTNGYDVVGHGTAVASLMVANVDDGFGMAGFGGAAHLISYRVDALYDNLLAIGITKLTSLGVRIINISIGGPDPTAPVLHDAILKSMYAGVLIVAAAGNDGTDSVLYPAADLQPPDGADSLGLAVGASDVTGKTTKFSNTGSNLSLIAPGDYDYSCSGVLAAISTPAKDWDNTCWPIVKGEGRRPLRVHRRHLLLVTGGRRRCGAAPGRAPRAPQLRGRGHHQALRAPDDDGLDADRRLRPARRRGRARDGHGPLQRRRADDHRRPQQSRRQARDGGRSSWPGATAWRRRTRRSRARSTASSQSRATRRGGSRAAGRSRPHSRTSGLPAP